MASTETVLFSVTINSGDNVNTDLANAWAAALIGGTGPIATGPVIATLAAVLELQAGSSTPVGSFTCAVQSTASSLSIRVSQP